MKAPTSKKHVLVTKLLIILAVAFSLLVTPFATNPACAKSLKASGVKFTKAGKVIKSKLWYAGIGRQSCTYSIKYVKVKKAKKAGYKTATVLCELKQPWTPTNGQIWATEADDDDYLITGYYWAFVVDGKTGANFEVKSVAKKYDVTCKMTGWVDHNVWRYTAPDGAWIEIPKVSRIKITITYPKSYKDLYVGVGVGQKRYNDAAMRKYEKGLVTYSKCWWNQKNKSATHFVHVK